MGKKRLYHYIRRFGFAERASSDLPFEVRGTLNHYRKWYDIDTATTAFGQGIGVNGLQMISALNVIANGGVLMKPQFVRHVFTPDGSTSKRYTPKRIRRVISRYTARLTGDMMTAVTEEGGTGKLGSMDGFLVAGKTGTAQKSEGQKGYHSEKWIASFIGFVPAGNPRIAISVVIDEPLISHYGGTVAAPALARIADKTLRYLGVSPEKRRNFSKRKNIAKDENNILADKKDKYEKRSEIVINDNETFMLEPGMVITPDLYGLSIVQAVKMLKKQNLRALFKGTGIAASQIPLSGTPLNRGSFVRAYFNPPGTSENNIVEMNVRKSDMEKFNAVTE